jgi:hypothetical protein
MLTAEARVETDRASRHLVQLCRHAGQMAQRPGHRVRHDDGGHAAPEMRHVEWSDTHGTIDVGWGRCTLEATADALTLRAEAADEAHLRRLQDMIAGRLETIGSRDRLRVTWQQAAATTTAAAPLPARPAGGRRVWTIVLVGAGVIAVAVHAGVIGGFLAAPRWTGWAADLILAAVVLKVVVLGLKGAVLGRVAHRRSAWQHRRHG